MGDLFSASADGQGSVELKPSELTEFDRLVLDAHAASGRTLDDLPYTDEFEGIYQALGGDRCGKSRREVFHRLHNLRKASRLPRVGRSAPSVPQITRDDEELLSSLVVQQVGTLGQRDQLPFTPRFDLLAQQFNDRTGRSLGNHDVWRLVAKLAK
jgi:hypothetical protein